MKSEGLNPDSRLLMIALAGCILLASLGISIVTVALPTLTRAFSAEVQQVQWVVLAYLLAVTVTIVSAGRMGDLYGNRRVLVAGLLLLTLASAACMWAPSLNWLIAGRVAQGLGAAILMSLPMSIAKGLVAKERVGSAMGLLGTTSAIGTAMGPSFGGVLIGSLGWQSAFAALTILGAGMLVLALKAIPKPGASGSAGSAINGGMDWAGNFWLAVALLCFALSATGGKVGMDIPILMLLALSAIALAAFVHTELMAAKPLVPVALLGERAISTALITNLLVGAIMMATLVVGPFFLSFGLGLSDAGTGLVMAVGPIAAALSGVPAGRMTDRFGADRTLLAGLTLATAGLCCFAILPSLFSIPGYVIALILITPGFQLFLAANNTAVMLKAADEHKGMVSGLLGLSRNLGFMAGASLFPLLFASMLDSGGLTGNSAEAIGKAFSFTFFSAAGLSGLAILLAVVAMGTRSSRAKA
ncbi:MFS transporter [Ottowia thiooxydans]|uniref:MFS transporter n=1 Tax=Ottowia thiooxydans TaxID=219182 RepID=UPI001FE1756B|nr:MFS transporter [Ottowia thiooxydans]